MINKKNLLISTLIGSGSVLLVLGLWFGGGLNLLEHNFYDYKFLMRGEEKPSEDIVIIAVDEDSLKRFGRWPWPREILAKAIDNLSKSKAAVIGVDMIFPEHSSDRAQDEIFAKALARAGCVIGASYFETFPEKVVKIVDGEMKIEEVENRELTVPIQQLKRSFAGIGFTNAYPDSDGVLRKATLKDSGYHSFSAVIAEKFHGGSFRENFPAKIYCNFRGGNKTYTRFSFPLVYDGALPVEWVKDKIILIGSTATGTYDHYPSPYEKLYSGVEFHATVIDNIINRDYITKVPRLVMFLLVVVFGLVTAQFFLRTRPIVSLIVFVAIIGAYFFLCQYFLFWKYNLHLDFIKPALTIIASYAGVMGYKFAIEESEKMWIRKTFSCYLNPEVIKEITANPGQLVLEGQKRFMTVLFSDIRGFTSIAERLTPEETVSMLNEYFSAMTEVVFKYHGTLDKFIGDGLMAFWGAPVPQHNHAERAVMCALEMGKRLEHLQQEWKRQNKPIVNVGIGIHTGEMIVGNMGSSKKMDYTAIGDNVNLASRLEGLTRRYNTGIIVSKTTFDLVKNKVEAHSLGEVKVRGREVPVIVYKVLSRK